MTITVTTTTTTTTTAAAAATTATTTLALSSTPPAPPAHQQGQPQAQRNADYSPSTTSSTPLAVVVSHKVANVSSPVRTIITILIWYLLSNCIILSTKYVFKNYFHFPLTVTAYANAIAALWAATLSCHSALRPAEPLSRHQFQTYVLPIGILTAMEIGCSNMALDILTVSFGTILKGMAPIFVFFWGLMFGLEKFSWKIAACLVTMASGIGVASLGQGREFEVLGFMLQLFSTCLSGLRWATTHKLLLEGPGTHNNSPTSDTTTTNNNNNNPHDYAAAQDDEENNTTAAPPSTRPTHRHMSPLTAILYTAPTTTLSILPVAILLEGHKVVQHELQNSWTESLGVWTTLTVIATLVFLLLMSEYWLVGVTSSLALSVAGVGKELVTIGSGIILLGDHVDALNVMGFSVCQVGILAYVFLRYDRSVSYEPVENGRGPTTTTTTTTTLSSDPQGESLPVMDEDESEEQFIDEAENIEMPGVRHRCH